MANVPISIDWQTTATWEGRRLSNKLSDAAMAKIMKCCIRGLDRAGKLSDHVQAVKVTPFVTHSLKDKRGRVGFGEAFYSCKITFAGEESSDECVVNIEIHFFGALSPLAGRETPAPEEEFISTFAAKVTEEVQQHQNLLQGRAVGWGNLLKVPVAESAR